MSREILIPGAGSITEDGEKDILIPGAGSVHFDQAPAPVGGGELLSIRHIKNFNRELSGGMR